MREERTTSRCFVYLKRTKLIGATRVWRPRLEPSRMWSCRRCTSRNSLLYSECQVCQCAREGKWQCVRCTVFSPYNASSCLSCGLNRLLNVPREDSPPISQPRKSLFKELKGKIVGGFKRVFSRSASVDLSDSASTVSPSESKEEGNRRDGRESEKGNWKCPKCTFNNKLDFFTCEMCRTAKPEVVVIDPNQNSLPRSAMEDESSSSYDGHSGTWECVYCTCINSSLRKECQQCRHPRYKETVERESKAVERSMSSSDGIACYFCTFSNPAGALECEMCHKCIKDVGTKTHLNEGTSTSVNETEMRPCPHCTLLNPSSASRCSACGSRIATVEKDNALETEEKHSVIQSSKAPDSDVVACHHCTYMNAVHVETCGMCHQPTKGGDVMKSGWWKCDKCRYNNEPNKTRCVACDIPITAAISRKLRTEQRQDRTWTCVKCTLKNPEGEVRCQICSTRYGDKQKGNGNVEDNTEKRRRGPSVGRQESWSMQLKRQVDEHDAILQWKNIISFCRMVRHRCHVKCSCLLVNVFRAPLLRPQNGIYLGLRVKMMS